MALELTSSGAIRLNLSIKIFRLQHDISGINTKKDTRMYLVFSKLVSYNLHVKKDTYFV